MDDLDPRRAVFLVTGIPGSGKSTVAAALARRFDRGAHIDGDVVREMVVTGRFDMVPDASEEARRSETPPIGLWLDTSAQTPDQTVDELLARAWEEATVPPVGPVVS